MVPFAESPFIKYDQDTNPCADGGICNIEYRLKKAEIIPAHNGYPLRPGCIDYGEI